MASTLDGGALSLAEVNALATYNAEIARGLKHTESWDQKMARLQERFNQASAESYRTGRPMKFSASP